MRAPPSVGCWGKGKANKFQRTTILPKCTTITWVLNTHIDFLNKSIGLDMIHVYEASWCVKEDNTQIDVGNPNRNQRGHTTIRGIPTKANTLYDDYLLLHLRTCRLLLRDVHSRWLKKSVRRLFLFKQGKRCLRVTFMRKGRLRKAATGFKK